MEPVTRETFTSRSESVETATQRPGPMLGCAMVAVSGHAFGQNGVTARTAL
jgi:hypothetical protein